MIYWLIYDGINNDTKHFTDELDYSWLYTVWFTLVGANDSFITWFWYVKAGNQWLFQHKHICNYDTIATNQINKAIIENHALNDIVLYRTIHFSSVYMINKIARYFALKHSNLYIKTYLVYTCVHWGRLYIKYWDWEMFTQFIIRSVLTIFFIWITCGVFVNI